jgi:hypothetical protein
MARQKPLIHIRNAATSSPGIDVVSVYGVAAIKQSALTIASITGVMNFTLALRAVGELLGAVAFQRDS